MNYNRLKTQHTPAPLKRGVKKSYGFFLNDAKGIVVPLLRGAGVCLCALARLWRVWAVKSWLSPGDCGYFFEGNYVHFLNISAQKNSAMTALFEGADLFLLPLITHIN